MGDFLKNAGRVLGSSGPITERTFGGSVIFGFMRRAILIPSITALLDTAAVSEMRT